MFWLRPILLLAGLLLLGSLIWLERRRPQRSAEGGAPRAERTEPTIGSAAVAGASAGNERETRGPPPVIVSEAAAPLAEPPPLLVDWPEEKSRRIVTLRVMPTGPDRLAGRLLRLGLAAGGFRHGPFGIFHLPGDDGRVILSAASLVRPGMLDPATMDFQNYPGVNIFAVLPGPLHAEPALQRLGQAALELAGRVAGRVQDDTGAPLSAAESGEWRRRILGALGQAAAPTEPRD